MMSFMTGVWTAACSALAWLTLNPGSMPDRFRGVYQVPLEVPHALHHGDMMPTSQEALDPPHKFIPPGGQPNDPFTCDYSNMPGWSPCWTPETPGCWLRHTDGREFNISTDYEKFKPNGTVRHYTLDVSNGTVNADGQIFPYAKLFNGVYPGPWIQACWGDTIKVNVTNSLPYNGTTIHWHGIRQLNSMEMDGVNGVTQCPIAPHDYFIYQFETTQYGSSWYHSHFSIQYADGLHGPLTIHGPTSASFDEAASIPLLMTDWDHVSAFETLHHVPSNNGSILLNGRGNVTSYNAVPNATVIPDPYTLVFNPPVKGRAKRYLLRLINTSFETTFIFSIDHHLLQVISADFVPIHPYTTTTILVGIGQRYNVIVEANPVSYAGDHYYTAEASTTNFWIRTNVTCDAAVPKGEDYMKTGILRYDPNNTATPTTQPWNVSRTCADEPFDSLIPIVPRTVQPAANGVKSTLNFGELFNITQPSKAFPDSSIAAFSLARKEALQIDYSDPIFNHLGDAGIANEHASWVVVPENFTSGDWVWLAIVARFAGAHPIHLHGHDFSILQTAENTPLTPQTFKPKLDNPPRRDVVLVPNDGFAVIAFLADNPGSWLVHCHIARHAAEGLAMQILERQTDANALWPPNSPAIKESKRLCANWDKWVANKENWFDPEDRVYQDDSGV